MPFRRACSYSVSITPPKPPATYSDVLVTFQQNGQNLINKSLDDLTIDGSDFIVELTQEETKMFTSGTRAWLQIRCFVSDHEAPGSPVYPIEVMPALNDTILPTS